MSIFAKLTAAVKLPGVARSFSRVGFERRAASFDPVALDVALTGKQCLVTGANAGR